MDKIEKIKNSLHHCIPIKCDGCDYHGISIGCAVQLKIDALSVIEEQQAEIERLQQENQNLKAEKTGFLEAIANGRMADFL